MADVVYFDGGIDLPFCPPTVNGIYISGSGCCSEFYSAFIGGNQTYNLTYTLPTASGSSGQVLTNDGNGNLSWTTVSGGGGGTGTLTGTGTTNYLSKWVSASGLTDSIVLETGSTIDISGALRVTASSGTSTTIAGQDVNGYFSNITVGSGLSLSGNILTTTGVTAGTVTGTGTTNYLSKWGSSSGLTNSIVLETGSTIDISGALRVTASSGTATAVMGRDANGYVSNLSLGNGLSISGGTLSFTGSTGVSGNFVPYLGATGNTNLGGYGIAGSYFQLSTSTGGTLVPGMFSWNGTDGTADLMLKGGTVTLPIGETQLARVINETGANLLKSQYNIVRVNGSTGTRLKVALALASGDATSAETLGIVAENITLNQEGFVITSGIIRGINTTGSLQGETWLDGDMLFLSPFVAGALTNIKPQAPNHLVVIGYVVTAANNGVIYVKVDNGYELDELHNVLISSAATNEILAYDGVASVWKNRTSAQLNLASGSGTATQVAFWGGATGTTSTALTSSTGLTWDNLNGRLGIGTNSPSGKIHAVYTNFSDVVVFERAPSFNSSLAGSSILRASYPTSPLDGGGPSFSYQLKVGNTITDIGSFGCGRDGADNSGFLSFSPFLNGTQFERMRITSSGNIGINTTSPSARLHIRGSGNNSTSTSFLVQNSSSNNMFSILDNGNIGINTNNPQQTLHIEGTMRLTGSTGTGTTLMGRNASGDVSAISIGSGLSLSGNTLSSTGGGGSGTVTGSGTATQVAFWSGATGTTSTALTSSTGLTWDNVNGRLGIGNVNPSNTLHLIGVNNTNRHVVFEGSTRNGRFIFEGRATAGIEVNDTGSPIANFSFDGQDTVFTIGRNSEYGYIKQITGVNPKEFRMYNSNNSTSLRIASIGNAILEGNSNIIFNTNGVIAAMSERMRINSSGQIGVNTATPNASSIFQIDSTTLGFLPPRMSTTNKIGIASPAQGLVVYDTTMQALSAYNGSNWATVGGGEQMFTITGSTATINFNAGNIADITLATSTTLTLTGGTFGTFIIKLTQDATGGRVVSWPSNVRWSGGIPPSLTTTGGKVDVISLIFDGTNYYGTYALNF